MTIHILADIGGNPEKFHKHTGGEFDDLMFLRNLQEPEPMLVVVEDVNNREVIISKRVILFAGLSE